jgi:GntR family transcriptional regulator
MEDDVNALTMPARDPLYHRIFETLRQEILAGAYDAEAALPSDKQLEDRFGVSRITIRRALDELARLGLVSRAKGKATRVADRRAPIFADVDDELGNMLAAISNLRTKVINFRWRRADSMLAERLHVPEREKLLWITRLRSRPAGPVMFSSLYLPLWAAAGLSREDLAMHPIVELLRARGVVLTSGEQTMRASACGSELARHLGLAAGEPIFFIRRLIRDAQHRPVMFNDVSFRADCFVYNMVLEPTREGAAGKPAAAQPARPASGLQWLEPSLGALA